MARKGTKRKPRRSRGKSKSPRRSSRKGSVWSSLLPKLGLVAVGVAGGVVVEQLVMPETHMGRAVVSGVGAAATVAVISMPFKSLRRTSALVPTMAFAGAAGAMYGARGWLNEKTGNLVFRIRNGRWPNEAERIIDTTATIKPKGAGSPMTGQPITGALPTNNFTGVGVGGGYGSGAGAGPAGTLPQPGVTNITYEAPKDNSTSLERIIGSIANAAADFGGKVLGGSSGGSISEEDALALAVA